MSGTVTFLFSDIEGSTALLKKVGRDRYGELLARHQELLREAFVAHRGHEVDTQGDSFFVAFHSSADAVAAAVAIQRALVEERWPEGSEVRVRIGIHSGEASSAGQRYVGFSVHRAARVGAIGHGGQILLSSATRELVDDDLPDGVTLRDLGAQRLKDVERPERVSQVVAPGLQDRFAPLQTARARHHPRRGMVVAVACLMVAGAAAVALVLVGGRSGSPEASAAVAADSVGIFRSSDGGFAGQAAVGTSPSAVAADSNAVWVANADSASVSRVDPVTGTRQQTVEVGNGPAGVAIAGGAVWVTNSLDGTVVRIDPQSNTKVQTVSVGSQPVGVVSGPVGLWVANVGDRTLMRIDAVSGRVKKTIALATSVDALAEGDGALWVASELNGTVERVDPRSGDTQPINVGRAPDAIAVGDGAVWVANNLDGTVTRINPSTNGVVTTIAVGASPTALALTSDGKGVWVSNELGGSLMRIDTTHNAVTKTVEIRDRPEGIALAAGRMYVAVRTSGAAHRGGTLRVAIAFPITFPGPKSYFLDPAVAGYANWFLPMGGGLANDGLVAFRRAGGGEGLFIAPDLAVSLPAPTTTGRTYTFQLRQGVHYSDGRLVRPADFRRTFERVLALGGDEQPGSYFDGIVGGTACVRSPKRCDLSRGITTTDNTVTFHLVRADPSFLQKLALPSAVVEPADTPLRPSLPLPATGPYMYRTFDKKRQVIELVRNPRFRTGSAGTRPDGFPNAIRIRFGYGADGAVHAVEHGRADLASIRLDNSLGVRTEVRVRYRGLLRSNPVLGVDGAILNTRIPPFSDRRVRQAFNDAVDRRRLVVLGGADLVTSTCQLLPPNLPGYRRYCPYMLGSHVDGPYLGPDLAKARRLIAASHTRGQKIVFRDVAALGPTSITQYLVARLRTLGYRVQLVRGEPKPGDQVAGGAGWSIDYPDASSFLIPIVGCGSPSNAFHFCNRRIDRELKKALAVDVDGPQAAARLWAKVDRDVTDEAPWVPYLNEGTVDIISRRVGNYVYSVRAQGVLYDQLWVR